MVFGTMWGKIKKNQRKTNGNTMQDIPKQVHHRKTYKITLNSRFNVCHLLSVFPSILRRANHSALLDLKHCFCAKEYTPRSLDKPFDVAYFNFICVLFLVLSCICFRMFSSDIHVFVH